VQEDESEGPMKLVNTRKNGGWSEQTYHTDPNCRYLSDSYREVQANEVENKDMSVCKVCADTHSGHDGGDKSIYELAKQIGEQADG